MTRTELTLILICITRLSINVECIQVVEKVQDDALTNLNTTTLYPVDKNVFLKSTTTERTKVDTTTNNSNITVWKINATFANAKDDDDEDATENVKVPLKTIKMIDDCKGQRKTEKDIKSNTFAFPKDKINTDKNKLKSANQDSKENLKPAKEKENESVSKNEFKPSPHLNSYYDSLDSPIHHHNSEIYTSPIETPNFFGYSKDKFGAYPVQAPEGFVAFPYQYGNNGQTHSAGAWSVHGLQSKPTVEAPVRIPAGGLYRHPDVLKDNPNSYTEDDEFEYNHASIDNIKENPIKKRANPWKKLLNLVTALLPAGLIISALAPRVITIENQEPGSTYHDRFTRLDDTEAFPVISEECKRRLLCEIHSDGNYPSNDTKHRRPKHCYKIHCEDPQSVNRALRWLLAFHRTGDTRVRENIQNFLRNILV